MAENYKNSILLGVKLRPTSEVQAELNTLISQLNGNSTIKLDIDTGQANQSLKEFSSMLNKISEQLRSGINLNGNTDNVDKQEQAVRRLSSTISNMQNKLNTASSNGFINESVLTNLQNKLNGINTNTAESEIKELQTAINNLSSTDSQIVRLQNAITKMETGLTNMKGKYGSLVGDSSSRTQLESYISQVEKLKTILNSLQNGGTISGAKLSSELNLGTNANRDLTTAVRNSSSALKLAQADANSFGQSIKNALSNAGLYVGTYQAIQMMVNAFKDGVSTVIQMDTALGNLNKVVSMSSAQLIQMRDSAVSMGQELGRSAIEVANAQAEFGRLYKTQDEINSMTKVSVMGANVMDNVSSADVAKGLTTIITSMKLEAKDSMGILDSMNEIQNNYRIGAHDLLSALSEVGSTAYTSGTNLKQVEGYITSIAVATGKSGDEIGNSLRSIMARVYKLGAEGLEGEGKPEKMLHDMGVEVRDSSGNFRNFSAILTDLDVKWKTMSNTQKIATAQVVGGINRYNDFMSLMNNYGMAVDSTNTALNSQGSALKENEIHMQTAEAKLGTLKATTEAFYLHLINSDAIKSAIDGLTLLVGTFGNLPTIIGLTTSALVAFSGKAIISAISSVGGYITSLISLASTEGIVATATGELTLAMSTNPFGLIAIAIASVTVGLVALNHAYEESTDYIGKINDATKGLQELKTNENLVKQYNDLTSTIDSTTSSVEQVTTAKEKLLGVQKQLATQYPNLIDGYTKEGDALVRNIGLVEDKITKDKKALGAEAESNYGKLINQVNNKQVNKMYDTSRDSIWYLPSTWKSDIEVYNNLLKESESNENGLSENRKNKLTELSTKFGDLNKAIVTMKDNGQDISGKQMFDFSTGKLVDAVGYLKDIENQSVKTSDKTKLISKAMKELSSSNIGQESIDALNKAYPNLGINVDNAKEKIKTLNDEINNGKTDGIDDQANAISKATKEYAKSTQEIAKMQGYLDKINKTHSLTPTLVAQISKAYPELANQVGNVTQLEESLKQKMQEQADSQLANYEIMMGADQSFYSEKIKNNQSFENSLNTFLNSFVTNSEDAYNIDTNNYKTLNELKEGIQGDFGESINKWLSQYVDTSAQGYSIDLSNFKSLADAKQGILKILKDEVDKLNQAMATMTQNIADQAKIADNKTDTTSGLQAEKLYGKDIDALQRLADKQKQVQGGIDDFNASFDKFGIAEKGLSGGSIGNGGTASGSSGKSKSESEAEKAQKLAEEIAKLKSEIEPDRYLDFNNAVKQVDNELNLNKGIKDNLKKDSPEYQSALEKDIKLYQDKTVALNNLNDEQKRERDELKTKLSNLGFEFDATGKLINSQKTLLDMQEKVNAMGGNDEPAKQAKEDAIKNLKDINDETKKYIELVGDKIPKTTEEWEEQANAIAKVKDEMKETLANYRDKIAGYELEELQSKQKKSEEDLENAEKKKKKALEDAKKAKADELDAQIKALQDQIKALDDESADNEKKLAKLKAERNLWLKDDSVFSKSKIADLDTKIAETEKTIKKDNLNKQIEKFQDEKDKSDKNYDKKLSDLDSYYEKTKEKQKKSDDDSKLEEKAYEKADKLLKSNNQKEILDLMTKYGKSYKDVGTLLGQNFKDGWIAQIEQAKKEYSSLMGNLSGTNSSNSSNSDSGITTGNKVKVSNTSTKIYSESDSSGYSKGTASDNSISSSDSFTVAETNNGKALLVGSGGGTAGWVNLNDIASYDTGGRTPDNVPNEGVVGILHKKEKILNENETNTFDNMKSQLDQTFEWIKSTGSVISGQLSSQYGNIGNYTMPSLGTDLNSLTNGVTNNTSTDNSNTQSISMPITIINQKGAEAVTEQQIEKIMTKVTKKQATRYGGRPR